MKCLPSLNKARIRQSFAAAAVGYDDSAALQRLVGRALLEAFPLPMSQNHAVCQDNAVCQDILDAGCGSGFFTQQLSAATANQMVVALDIALSMLLHARQKHLKLSPKSLGYVCADAESMPFRASSFQAIYSNLAFQWCRDLPKLFGECRRILRTNGQLVFSSFGTASLQELKAAWAAVDDLPHVNEFYALADIEAYLQLAGFADIQLQSVIYQRRYDSVLALMRELKGLGARNVQLQNRGKITTRKQLQQMIAHYEQQMQGGDLLASYEIIYVRAVAV